jgi:hypothetical protein
VASFLAAALVTIELLVPGSGERRYQVFIAFCWVVFFCALSPFGGNVVVQFAALIANKE